MVDRSGGWSVAPLLKYAPSCQGPRPGAATADDVIVADDVIAAHDGQGNTYYVSTRTNRAATLRSEARTQSEVRQRRTVAAACGETRETRGGPSIARGSRL